VYVEPILDHLHQIRVEKRYLKKRCEAVSSWHRQRGPLISKEASKVPWPPRKLIGCFITLLFGGIPRNAHGSLRLLPKTQWKKMDRWRKSALHTQAMLHLLAS
jgi:hypothetical protein